MVGLFALRVEAAPEKIPAIVSPNGVTFQAGNASSFMVTTSGTPAPSIATTGVLPSGLSFVDGRGSGKGIGTLSGTAVRGSGGRYPITFTATNAHGSSSQNFALVVCDAIQIANPSVTNVQAGAPLSATFTEAGGAGTTTFTVASGSLPAGLTLSADGRVSGTPFGPGTSSIVVRATDANGCSGVSATWTLAVACPSIVVTSPIVNTGTVSKTFSQQFTQTGGLGVVAFTTSSALPRGLNLAPTGTLSGVPTQAGTFTIDVKATDAVGCTGSRSYAVTIIPMPTVAITAPAPGTAQLTASNDARCNPGPCPNLDPLLFAFSASTTAADTSQITFLLNGQPLGPSVHPVNGSVVDVQRTIPNGPQQQLAVQVLDGYGNVATSSPMTVDVNSVPPVASADAFETADGTPVTAAAPGLFANDSLHGALLIGYGANGNEQTTSGAATPTQAGGSVAVASDGSFIYNPPPVTSIVQDVFRYTVANPSGSAIGTVTLSLYPHVCGTQPINVAVNTSRPAGPMDFDPYALSAAATSLDDDSSTCPARFSHAPYSFSWSVSGPAKYSLSSNSGASTTLMLGATGTWNVTATATSQKSGDAAAGSQTTSIVTTCNTTPAVMIDVAAGASIPHTGAAGGDFNRDDVITLRAQASFPCYSSPATAAPTFSWLLDGGVLQNANTASPSFIVDAASKRYTAEVTAMDRWGNASAPASLSLSSSSCGASPVNVAVNTSRPAGVLPFDPYALAATSTSADDDASVCPARFAQSYNVLWNLGGATVATTLSPTTGPSTTFMTGYSGVATITASATGAKSGVTGSSSMTLNTLCASPGPVVAAPSIASVTPPNGDTFARAPGQIFRDDVVTLTTTVYSPCQSLPVFTYAWSLWNVTGDSDVALSSATSASPSFIAKSSSAIYGVAVVVFDSLGHSSDQVASTTFSVSSCGANPVNVAVNTSRPAGPMDFDPYALSAAATSLDDDPSICPARFSHAPYSFSWSVNGPAKYSLSSNSGAATTLMLGTTGAWNVTATATSQKLGDTAAGSQTTSIVTTCNTTPAVMIDVAAGASIPHTGAGGGDFNRDDVITLRAQASFACYSSPAAAAPTFSWLLDGGVLQNANSASPSFIVDAASKRYTAEATVMDRWGNASAPASVSLSSSSCGANQAVVAVSATAQAKPMDPWSLLATATSLDDDVTQCPARFGNAAYLFTFSATPSDGTTFSPAALAGGNAATLTPAAPAQHTVTVTAQGTSGDPSGSAVVVIDSSCAPPTVASPTVSPAQSINAGDTVTLSVTAISNCISAPAFQYAWTVSSSDGQNVIGTPSGSDVSFVAEGFNTTYTASVAVMDAGQTTTSNAVTFTTSSCGSTPPSVAAASITQTVPFVTFVIDGTAQTGDITITLDPLSGLSSTTIGQQTYPLPFYLGFPVLSQLYFRLVGNCASARFASATLTGPPATAPAVTVPSAQTIASGTVLPFAFTPTTGDLTSFVNDPPIVQQALYGWLLNVHYGAASAATVAVQPIHVAGVCGGNPPVATFRWSFLGDAGAVTVGQPVQLDASQSSDPDNSPLFLSTGGANGCGLNQALTYSWSITAAPAASAATVSPASWLQSSFVPDVAGTYTIKLVVTDSTGLSSPPLSQDIVVVNPPSP